MDVGTEHDADNNYDVVVIGGGIQGCGVAQAAAAAGFKTLLIEQQQWGWATSSRSSKLIHGGLRYLQTGQFHLVRECLAERDWMIRHCPDLVQANWFYLPVYQHSHYRAWFIHLGLWLYQGLNWGSEYGRFKRLPRSEWQAIEGLQQQGLKAVFAYQDGQTDDQRLTQAVQRSAAELGAECWSACQLQQAHKEGTAYRLQLQRADAAAIEVYGQVVVNATGPWVNDCLQRFKPAIAPVAVDLIQGTHIVIDKQINSQGFYVEAPSDGRAVFILPWRGKTLIGTTETRHQGAADESQPTAAEIDYLSATLQHYFPALVFTITESFSGLRVLPKAQGAAFSRPREVMLEEHPGLISLYGGKLTAWRATAESVLARIEGQLGRRRAVNTRTIALKAPR